MIALLSKIMLARSFFDFFFRYPIEPHGDDLRRWSHRHQPSWSLVQNPTTFHQPQFQQHRIRVQRHRCPPAFSRPREQPGVLIGGTDCVPRTLRLRRERRHPRNHFDAGSASDTRSPGVPDESRGCPDRLSATDGEDIRIALIHSQGRQPPEFSIG